MSRRGDPSNPDREWDWVVPDPSIDFAQKKLDEVSKGFREKYKHLDLSAYKFRVEKRMRQ